MTKELTEAQFVAGRLLELPWRVAIPKHTLEKVAEAAIEAHKAHLSASGLVIVPRVPTEAMKQLMDEIDVAVIAWEWLLDAALPKDGK